MLVTNIACTSHFLLLVYVPAEDQLLATVISNVNGAAMQFRLAPAYVLYLTLRSRASSLTRPDLTAVQRDERVNICANKIVRRINHLIRVSKSFPFSVLCCRIGNVINFSSHTTLHKQIVSIVSCQCIYYCPETSHGKITRNYSRYCTLAFCYVHKCELSNMCPGNGIKLHPHRVKLCQIGCVGSGVVLAKALT